MGLFNRKKKILIVEDEPDIAESLKARLDLEDFEVQLAGKGEEGVTLARKQKPDLIILDVMLPGIDGYEVCKILKEDPKTQKIPILILTALPHLEDAEKAFSAGANEFLNKPYTNERLLIKVRKLLSK